MHEEVRAGTHTPANGAITVREAGADWLRTAAQSCLERTTQTLYKSQVELHINPFIGSARLSDLTIPSVRAFETKLGEEGVSLSMVKRVLGSFSAILFDAVERGHLGKNVVDQMNRSRRRGRGVQNQRRHKKKLKVGVDIPSPTEISLIIAQLDGRWDLVFLMAIFTGLRASELRGLNWSSIDFQKAEDDVVERADIYKMLGSRKSESAQRQVPLPPILLKRMREWKLASGGEGLVFPNGRGNIEERTNICSRHLWPALIRAGVTRKKTVNGKVVTVAKYTGLHALRHFYASWCINPPDAGGLGLVAKVVQQRMGHATIAMTMDTYGHLFPRGDDNRELAQAEDVLIAHATKP